VTGSGRPNILRKLWPDSLHAAHYIFAAVFLVRLVVLIRLASSPLLLPTGSDMHFYDEWAKQILRGHWTDHQAFYGLPLYPFIIALLYQVFGYGPFVPGFFQTCLEAGTAVLIYKITVRAMADGPGKPDKAANLAGIAAAAAWCFFLPAQAYSAILMPTAGAVFVLWFLIWQVVRTENALSRWRCFICGVLIGFAAMGVATILFLIPLFLVALFVRPNHANLAAKGTAAALLLLGVFAGTSPCWLHNSFVARDPVFLSAHGGINLWLGNNPAATGYPRFPDLHAGQGEMLRDSIDQAETAAGRPLKHSEVSRYWSGKARDYIAANPGAWLKLLTRKIGNFWNAFEYDDLGVIAILREQGVVFPGLRFALVAMLGLSGAVFSWRAFPASRWIAAAIALQLLAILPVFVTERYRLGVVPGLLVLAALGLAARAETTELPPCNSGSSPSAPGLLRFHATILRFGPWMPITRVASRSKHTICRWPKSTSSAPTPWSRTTRKPISPSAIFASPRATHWLRRPITKPPSGSIPNTRGASTISAS
jgi:hypothetical protein